MKILMLTTSYPRWKGDFSGRMIHNLALNLVKRGHVVHVLNPHWKGSREHEMLDGVHVHRFRYADENKEFVGHGGLVHKPGAKIFSPVLGVFVKKFYDETLKLDRKENFDVVHANWPVPSGLVGAAARRRTGKPLVTHLRFSMIDWPPWSWLMRPMNNYVFKSSDRIVAISPQLADYPKRLGFGKKTHIVLNGIDAELFDGKSKPLKKSGTKKVVYAGNLAKYKGVDVLLEAYEHVKGAQLHIYGTGPMERWMKNYVKEKNLPVYFHGVAKHEKMPAILGSADLFVLPSVDEGGGNILLEAMAMGRPIVTTTGVGFAPVVMKNGRDGIVVEPGDADALAKAMNRILGDYSLAKKLASSSRKAVLAKCSWAKCAEGVERVYKEAQRDASRA